MDKLRELWDWIRHPIRSYKDKKATEKRLAELRKRGALTQEDLARLCGIDQAALSRLENNQANVTIETLTRILDALGYKIVFVAEEEGE